ncbi:MAG: hypothetical protein CMF55_06730 [Legionellales bacterium]|nr:hypothetical protein [Legionellales bacterium]
MSPSDLPVNEIGNKHLHFKHDINLEQSDSGFARAKIKDQLFVDHLLMQDFIDVYQHQNAEKLVTIAVSAGVFLRSPNLSGVTGADGNKQNSSIYSSGLMRWNGVEKSIRKKWGDDGMKIIYDHVILDVWTDDQEKVGMLGRILTR